MIKTPEKYNISSQPKVLPTGSEYFTERYSISIRILIKTAEAKTIIIFSAVLICKAVLQQGQHRICPLEKSGYTCRYVIFLPHFGQI